MALDLTKVTAGLSMPGGLSLPQSLNRPAAPMGEGLKLRSAHGDPAGVAIGGGLPRAPEQATGGLLNTTDRAAAGNAAAGAAANGVGGMYAAGAAGVTPASGAQDNSVQQGAPDAGQHNASNVAQGNASASSYAPLDLPTEFARPQSMQPMVGLATNMLNQSNSMSSRLAEMVKKALG